MTIFDIVGDVVTKRSGGTLDQDPEFHKAFSSFMLVRYLSMRRSLMFAAEILNGFQGTLTAEQFYHLAYGMVPKQSSGFIKYISKKKRKSSDEESS